MRRVETEKTVVEHLVIAFALFLYPYCGMTVQFIDGPSGLTGEQICVNAVILSLDLRKD